MMTIEDMKRAHRLTAERERIAAATWDAVTSEKNIVTVGRNEWGAMAADEALQWAIEEFRARKLAKIDAQLRELGVEPPQMAAADA